MRVSKLGSGFRLYGLESCVVVVVEPSEILFLFKTQAAQGGYTALSIPTGPETLNLSMASHEEVIIGKRSQIPLALLILKILYDLIIV